MTKRLRGVAVPHSLAAMTSPDHPGASSFVDRHGKVRWRFRRKGKVVTLPDFPGEPTFEEAYLAAIEGRKPRKADIIRHPSAVQPETLGAAWKKVLASAEWKRLDEATKSKNSRLADAFLSLPVAPGSQLVWRDARVADLRRRHLKTILSQHSETPHKAKHLLVTIRKMIAAALDEEWIEVDPSYKLVWRPDYAGWKAWPDTALEAFERRWPLGSSARTVYALALWLGNRRGDVAALRWDHMERRRVLLDGQWRDVDGFAFAQKKGGERRHVFLPVTPMLADALAALTKRDATVALTGYDKPFSAKSLTGAMAHWTKLAGIAPGHTLHGLRKTLGKMLGEGDATTRQIMEALGHDDIAHAELYSREAEKTRLATQAMDKVVRLKTSRG